MSSKTQFQTANYTPSIAYHMRVKVRKQKKTKATADTGMSQVAIHKGI